MANLGDLQAQVIEYIDRGFSPIPVEPNSKFSKINGWQNLRIDVMNIIGNFTDADQNIGVVLRKPSDDLVDIDLDCEEALRLAPYLLPPTNMIFGRDSKPRSHWIYKAENPGRRLAFNRPDGRMLVELRAEGCMTVFPGSTHPSGEVVRFDEKADPAEVNFEELAACTRRLAVACLILPYYRPQNRKVGWQRRADH
jgi:hypothetical protein